MTAWEQLIGFVSRYFSTTSEVSADGVYQTNLAPIYLQRPRHSLTIVGYAVGKDGTFHLVVFDPGSNPSSEMRNVIDSKDAHESMNSQTASTLLAPYLFSKKHLAYYKNFETLILEET